MTTTRLEPLNNTDTSSSDINTDHNSELDCIECLMFDVYKTINKSVEELFFVEVKDSIRRALWSSFHCVYTGKDVEFLLDERLTRMYIGICMMSKLLVRSANVEIFFSHLIVVKEIEWSQSNKAYLEYIDDLESLTEQTKGLTEEQTDDIKSVQGRSLI